MSSGIDRSRLETGEDLLDRFARQPQVQRVGTHVDLPRPLDPATFLYANSCEHIGIGPRRKDATSHQIAQIDFASYAVTEPEPNSITVQRPHIVYFAHFKKSPAPLSIAPRPSPSGARVQAPKECSSNISSGAARRSRTDSGASWTSAAVTSESTGISPARKSRTRPLDHVANSRSTQRPST